MPLKVDDASMGLPEPRPWTLNVKTGESSVQASAK
jgi:hypothetical protein